MGAGIARLGGAMCEAFGNCRNVLLENLEKLESPRISENSLASKALHYLESAAFGEKRTNTKRPSSWTK